MNCPYCNFRFRLLAVGGDHMPDIAPTVCEHCGEISLIECSGGIGGRGCTGYTTGMTIRKVTAQELAAIHQSPAWEEVLGPVKKFIDDRNRALRRATVN